MKIQILMSTYNGENYIRTQLESIVNQDIEEKSLLIRDDGSSDNTLAIIKEFAEEYPWIKYYCGKNIGSCKSFMELIYNSDPEAKYIALADQDDFWMSEKLKRAQICLEKCTENNKESIPLLYCSNKQIVGKQLESLDVHIKNKVRKTAFGNALVQNICTGCTAVLNRELVLLLKKHPLSNMDSIIMHDWWLYLTASCFGQVFFDQNAYVLYRQHGNNVHGAMTRHRDLIKYRVMQLTKPRGEIYRQAELFLECFHDMFRDDNFLFEKKILEKLLNDKKSILGRIRLVFDKNYYRQKLRDDIIFRIIILLGKV